MRYRFENERGEPLVSCPRCCADFTAVRSIRVWYATQMHVWDEPGHLMDTGELPDPEGFVASGKHAGTTCEKCGEGIDEYGILEKVRTT